MDIEKIKQEALSYAAINPNIESAISFYDGATSNHAKEYWFQQFQLEEAADWEQSFTEFFDKYKAITGLPKTDTTATKKHWKALKKKQRILALENIQKYYDSIDNKKYCNSARSYLSKGSYLNEFEPIFTKTTAL